MNSWAQVKIIVKEPGAARAVFFLSVRKRNMKTLVSLLKGHLLNYLTAKIDLVVSTICSQYEETRYFINSCPEFSDLR